MNPTIYTPILWFIVLFQIKTDFIKNYYKRLGSNTQFDSSPTIRVVLFLDNSPISLV